MSKQQWLPLLLIYVNWLAETSGADIADVSAPVLEVYQPPHIDTEIGHPVSLNCAFNYTGKDENLIFGKFTKGNSEKERTVPVRCQLFDSRDKRFTCSFSLTIESPSLEDESVYYCEVKIPSADIFTEGKGSGTLLSLHAQPSSIEIHHSSPLVSGHKSTLDCKVSGFYPRNLTVLWFHGGTPVLPGSITESIIRNYDGTFSLHSQYTFSPMVKDNNAECVCQASHPPWTKETSLTLSVHYGPITVNVSSDSVVVTHGSVHAITGSTLNLMCATDGNPKPKTQWLGGSIKGVHHEEALHIPAVQKEHEGLYWCVSKNMYGERNTSVTLLVSYNDGNTALYGLAAIPVILVLVTVVIFLHKKGQKNTNALAAQGLRVDGQELHHDEPTQPEGVTYSKLKRCKKKPEQPRAVLDSSQMVYADIQFPALPRNLTVTNDETRIIYSEVGNGRGHDQDRKGQKQVLDSVYALVKKP